MTPRSGDWLAKEVGRSRPTAAPRQRRFRFWRSGDERGEVRVLPDRKAAIDYALRLGERDRVRAWWAFSDIDVKPLEVPVARSTGTSRDDDVYAIAGVRWKVAPVLTAIEVPPAFSSQRFIATAPDDSIVAFSVPWPPTLRPFSRRAIARALADALQASSSRRAGR